VSAATKRPLATSGEALRTRRAAGWGRVC